MQLIHVDMRFIYVDMRLTHKHIKILHVDKSLLHVDIYHVRWGQEYATIQEESNHPHMIPTLLDVNLFMLTCEINMSTCYINILT